MRGDSRFKGAPQAPFPVGISGEDFRRDFSLFTSWQNGSLVPIAPFKFNREECFGEWESDARFLRICASIAGHPGDRVVVADQPGCARGTWRPSNCFRLVRPTVTFRASAKPRTPDLPMGCLCLRVATECHSELLKHDAT